MKKLLLFIAFSFLFSGSINAIAPSIATSTTLSANHINPLSHFASLSIKEVQKLAGRKLTLKEKIAVKVLQLKIRKTNRSHTEYKDKGKTALIFGIVALACFLLAPVLFFGTLAALVFGIAAVVTGNRALKENPDNKKARTATILGWVAIGLLIAFAALAIVTLATL